MRLLCLLLSSVLLNMPALAESIDPPDSTEIHASGAASFRIETVASGVTAPWSLAFLPDGKALFVERDLGRLHMLDVDTGTLSLVTGLPELVSSSELSAGLFDVRPHPEFVRNRQVYLAYTAGTEEALSLVMDRMVLEGTALSQGQRLFTGQPALPAKWHFGGRIQFSGGHVYLTTGDGYEFRELSQQLDNSLGKVVRLRLDGSIPRDNPFVERPGALPEIYAYGLRNPQGMTVHPETGAVWTNEHGPQGGDEINILLPGTNYGWPVISYGEEYGGGPIGAGITHAVGMAQPSWYWRPSIAPSGFTFYQGSAFPGWQHSVFSGALGLQHLNRLVVEEGRIIHEERLLEDQEWRVRFVETGPDGYLYFGIDQGLILRIVPAAG